MGAELSHADGQTGGQTDRHDEANKRFSQFWQKVHTLFRKSWKKDSLREKNLNGRVIFVCGN